MNNARVDGGRVSFKQSLDESLSILALVVMLPVLGAIAAVFNDTLHTIIPYGNVHVSRSPSLWFNLLFMAGIIANFRGKPDAPTRPWTWWILLATVLAVVMAVPLVGGLPNIFTDFYVLNGWAACLLGVVGGKKLKSGAIGRNAIGIFGAGQTVANRLLRGLACTAVLAGIGYIASTAAYEILIGHTYAGAPYLVLVLAGLLIGAGAEAAKDGTEKR